MMRLLTPFRKGIGPMRRIRHALHSFRRDESGVSLMEFALILPVVVTLGLYGTELAYMAMIKMQVTNIATSVADNASRLGQTDNAAVTPNVKESDINSVMLGALTQGASFGFQDHGRVILSSLEINSAGNQYIHWQRCKGTLARGSSYGQAGKVLTDGMGAGEIRAVANSAVMFVEVYFDYQPLFGDMFTQNATFHEEAAYLIRDDRDIERGVTGTSPSTC